MKQPDIVRRQGFLVMGIPTTIKPGTERPETFAAIWKNFETHRAAIERLSADPGYYGVSFPTTQGTIDYVAGMVVPPGTAALAGLVVREIAAATYAVFACHVQAIGQTYGYIFGEWSAASGHRPDPLKPAFEQYPAATNLDVPVLIHIPIREDHSD
ncbi:MAG: GyrI-like domain-containing protein [Verrucomicrobia bacterium]|nr:GyrI-like domain-containing protein [Verrucomicrobiota bacterium]